MLSAIFALAMFAEEGAPFHVVLVCNDMKVNVESETFEAAASGANVPLNTPLEPGACASVLSMAPGDYTLHFIEHGANDQVAMCVRKVTVKLDDTIRISPSDGSSCIQ